jgi:hypothetical protein
MKDFFVLRYKGDDSTKLGLPIFADMFIPDFDETDLEHKFNYSDGLVARNKGLQDSSWEHFKGITLDVFYQLNYINFDFCDTYRGLKIASQEFANLCDDFNINFEFVPVNIRLRRRGVNKRKAKHEDFNVSPDKSYGLFFLKDRKIFAMDIEKSSFCVRRDEAGRVIPSSAHPYNPHKFEFRYIYEYVLDTDIVRDKHLFECAEGAHHGGGGIPHDFVCSLEFMGEFIKRGLLGGEFSPILPAYKKEKLHWEEEYDPRCWILDKGEAEIFIQPKRPRLPGPKLPG